MVALKVKGVYTIVFAMIESQAFIIYEGRRCSQEWQNDDQLIYNN